MKTILQASVLAFAALFLIRCEEDPELVTYPESYPVFETVQVAESVINYNDSISLSVQLSDDVTPLSTLEIQVVLNNEVIATESIRTRGNESVVTRRYYVPFGPGALDNEPVKVYLSSINVDGFTTDTIISTTMVKRPVVDQLYIVPESGPTYKLELIDTANLIFRGTGLEYGSSIGYRLATKITKFNKPDWSGLVFGFENGGIDLISEPTDDNFITISDESLLRITEYTFDAIQLTATIAGDPLEPVTTLDVNADLDPKVLVDKNFMTGNVYFGKDVEVTFTGITNLTNSLSPDYFEVTGENTAKFIGNTAVYTVYYLIDGNYLYVDPLPETVFPDAMWVNGTGIGRPSTPYEITTRWDWRTPLDYVSCRLVSPGVFQFTAYLENTPDGSGYGTLDFKFFHQRTWGGEVNASEYTVAEPLFGLGVEGKNGNVNGMTTPFEGVYRVTIDVNTKTITPVKLN